MEKMPFRDQPTVMSMPQNTAIESDWRRALPVLAGSSITLRELRLTDASSLLAMLSSEEVARFISPPPTTIEGYERFITWTQQEREAGNYLCFGVAPQGRSTIVGLFQVRQTDPDFSNAEWGFALGSAYWGSGIFTEAANMVLDFMFDVVGAHRLEARAAVQNGRGNGALRKLGALQEGILRRSFLRRGEYLDQVLWAIIDSDRQRSRTFNGPSVH
jgi:ribosomal-protein-alanine N-acetyltransferase